MTHSYSSCSLLNLWILLALAPTCRLSFQEKKKQCSYQLRNVSEGYFFLSHCNTYAFCFFFVKLYAFRLRPQSDTTLCPLTLSFIPWAGAVALLSKNDRKLAIKNSKQFRDIPWKPRKSGRWRRVIRSSPSMASMTPHRITKQSTRRHASSVHWSVNMLTPVPTLSMHRRNCSVPQCHQLLFAQQNQTSPSHRRVVLELRVTS